ncbi:50S ribosomal protein L29 [Candidatus Poribacteria bacterium]|jgi:large subunit ribosomal protein L29|nr:50S ribosomal protein L29 [Candidatus Poribacteria bacterium]MEE2912058.1 50S ribosomal protein L29 [Candidatus Poribacteria bacterium]
MKASEIRTKSSEELEAEIQNQKENLFNLKFRNRLAQIEDNSQIKKVRRSIARMRTIIRERDLPNNV